MENDEEFLFSLSEYGEFTVYELQDHVSGDKLFYQRLCRVAKNAITPDDEA